MTDPAALILAATDMVSPKILRFLGPAALGLLAATMSLDAWAQPGPGGGGGRQGPRGPQRPGGMLLNAPMEGLAARLDLTEAQQSQLQAIRKEYRDQTEKDWQEVRRVRGELQALWTSGEVPTKKQVVALRTEMMGHRTRIADLMVDARITALTVLKPEQRKLLVPGRGMGRGLGRGAGRRGS